ncbi:MAG: hydrogenase maturation nickel metallochaperone HypA [Candidatus Aminicenantes bacterium]|nr:hydrogenase maturation nickel metallochaperone HypA [Candidatus Aminicenantes bacterium]
MHEFALAEDIINTISSKVTGQLKTISQINIDVGAFSGIVVDSLEFGLQIILKEKANTMAKINIRQVPTIARCECGSKYEIKNMFDSCPSCQSYNRKIISGIDVMIHSVEIKENEENAN